MQTKYEITIETTKIIRKIKENFVYFTKVSVNYTKYFRHADFKNSAKIVYFCQCHWNKLSNYENLYADGIPWTILIEILN